MSTWFNELLKVKKLINANPRLIYEDKRAPILGTDTVSIQNDLEDYLAMLREINSGAWKKGLPRVISEWYERKMGTNGRGYVPHYRDFTSKLMKLKTINAMKMFLVYRDHANNGNTVNKMKLYPGETCIGEKTLAIESRVSLGRIYLGNRELAEAGLVVVVRRLWFNGPLVRKVDMGWEKPIIEESMDNEIP